MLTPSQLEHIADDVVELYSQLQDSIVADIARRVVRMGEISQTSEYQIKILQENGMVYQDAIREVAKITAKSEEEIRKAFEAGGAKAINSDNRIFQAAGIPVTGGLSPGAEQLLKAAILRTNATLRGLTLTTARQSQVKFRQAIDQAFFETASGGVSYDQAIRNAIGKLGREGITVVKYSNKYTSSVTAAVRSNVLTAMNQVAGEIQIENMKGLTNYVEVSAHWNARPSHSEWQGGVYRLEGSDSRYQNFYTVTGYGSGDGLCGWNCRHSFYPFIMGVSSKNYTSDRLLEFEKRTVEWNGSKMPAYDATQIQRRYEVALRKSKAELAAIDAARMASNDITLIQGLNKDFDRVSRRLSAQQDRLKSFLEETGFNRERAREWTYGYNRSVSAKAQRAIRRAG